MSQACPGVTRSEYTTVFTAYAWIAFYNRNPAYQVWARGITIKKDTHTLDFDVTLMPG
ncbi:MAG: hypothetical protein JRF50_10540 [Deltaproteobacteria bacterium]|nr:hypothetical protein [Deltaproteobacteria bacterium]